MTLNESQMTLIKKIAYKCFSANLCVVLRGISVI